MVNYVDISIEGDCRHLEGLFVNCCRICEPADFEYHRAWCQAIPNGVLEAIPKLQPILLRVALDVLARLILVVGRIRVILHCACLFLAFHRVFHWRAHERPSWRPLYINPRPLRYWVCSIESESVIHISSLHHRLRWVDEFDFAEIT